MSAEFDLDQTVDCRSLDRPTSIPLASRYHAQSAISSTHTPPPQQHKISPSTNNNMHKKRTQHENLLSETEESRCRRSEVIDNVVVHEIT